MEDKLFGSKLYHALHLFRHHKSRHRIFEINFKEQNTSIYLGGEVFEVNERLHFQLVSVRFEVIGLLFKKQKKANKTISCPKQNNNKKQENHLKRK